MLPPPRSKPRDPTLISLDMLADGQPVAKTRYAQPSYTMSRVKNASTVRRTTNITA